MIRGPEATCQVPLSLAGFAATYCHSKLGFSLALFYRLVCQMNILNICQYLITFHFGPKLTVGDFVSG